MRAQGRVRIYQAKHSCLCYNLYMYACMYVYTYVCMYLCMHACMYVWYVLADHTVHII